MDRKNIILDFMDPENRILYGSYKNLDPDEHVRLLTESLNLAILLCDEYCIIPPCAVMQCQYARKALENSSYYLDEGLVRFPVRESSLDQFIEKKRVNYSQDKENDNYSEFFATGGPAFLKKHATAIIKRETRVGSAVAEMVAATPFDNPLWENLVKWYSKDELLKIKMAPRELIQKNEAVSVIAIKRLIKLRCAEDVDFEIGRILQNKYFYIYIYEYDGRIIHEIPPKTTDFLIEHFGPSYEYSFWKYIFKSLGFHQCIKKSDSYTICEIRDVPNCYDFISSLMNFGDHVGSVSNAKKSFPKILKKMREIAPNFSIKNLGSYGPSSVMSEEIKKYLYQLFDIVSDAINATVKGFEQSTPLSRNNKEITYNSIVKKNIAHFPLKKCDNSKPFAFLAYSQDEMEELVYRDCILLGKMGINYWIDKANMVGANKNAQGWREIANEALKQCSIFVPYISSAFLDSTSCCEEVKTFMEHNGRAGIVLLISNGYSIDEAIRKISTYNNILEGEAAQNMIKLFQVTPNNSKNNYNVDQLYRICGEHHFEYYINDALFYNTFAQYGLIDIVQYPDYQSWYDKASRIMEEITFE